jgi:ATP10 protein
MHISATGGWNEPMATKWVVSMMLAAVLSCVAFSAASAQTPAPVAPHFPPLRASSLERKSYHLPEDFEGDVNVCLIAFKREQQKNVDTWTRGLKPLNLPGNVHVYEMPTISKGPRFFTSWLDGRMRAGIHDKQAREMTITLYLNKGSFRKALAIPDEKTIYVLLIDKQGAVLWRTTGDFTDDKGQELMAALKTLPAAAPAK